MVKADPHNRRTNHPMKIGASGKIVILGVLLAGLVLPFLWPTGPKSPEKPAITRPPMVDANLFRPDAAILARIKDATPLERGGGLDREVWDHLMRKSYNIGPAAAAALRLPAEPADPARLRERPESHRGEFLWVKGHLQAFEQQKLHPLPRARAFKGRLVTDSGENVIFWVSQPLPDDVADEDRPFVRIEGFFVKIVDEHSIDEAILGAPLLIGPRIVKAYPDWQAVDRLDPVVLGRIKLSTFDEETGQWDITPDAADYITDAQGVPLWHLAGFAIDDAERNEGTGRRHTDIFELKEQYDGGFRIGKYEQGARFRLRGTFVIARVYRADVNPVGINYWTSAWIRIARLGATMIPIWIPEDIGEWKFGEGVDVDAFYFKNRAYRTEDGSVRHTPQFVAAHLTRSRMASHPAVMWMGIVFALVLLLLAFLFFRMGRQARRDSEEYKAKLVARRRQRRAASAT